MSVWYFRMRCCRDNVNSSYAVKLLCLQFIWITLVQTSNLHTSVSLLLGRVRQRFLFCECLKLRKYRFLATAVHGCSLTSTHHLSSSRKHSVHHLQSWRTRRHLKRRTDSKGIMIGEWRCVRVHGGHLMCRATRGSLKPGRLQQAQMYSSVLLNGSAPPRSKLAPSGRASLFATQPSRGKQAGFSP